MLLKQALASPLWQGNKFSARLPGTEWELDKLHSMCTQAVFGMGTETVYGPCYRSASALTEYSFDMNFDPGDHRILEQIGQTLGFQGVFAEQDKLNLYRRGDFFKTHVDIPAEPSTNGAMFGTLVLCLPSWHMGGELAISHGPLKASTDWAEASADNAVQ
ncbi:hypothetical protein WJX74_010177 [Apatococcus lobatus]|uniref:Prolyl 4-hydroxylase alpha subunit Fe(2+) 2OG dioxygenase domain-containing protein n=1 Tax=Apatococcus lobatus TaxID=904363 RepID=A0AAW1RBR4_9CHLO